MGLDVSLDLGRAACVDSVDAFVRAVDDLSEYELLGASRCYGWSRLDVLVHVTAGWQDMLGGFVSTVDDEPTVDAASYWPAFAREYADADPVATLISQRRRTSTYATPGSAREHHQDVAAAVLRGLARLTDQRLAWQGHVFSAGDFAAIWAVEHAVHQLDLLVDEPTPDSALELARATVESLLGNALPDDWSDEEATLIGAGRAPVPAGFPDLTDRLPVLG